MLDFGAAGLTVEVGLEGAIGSISNDVIKTRGLNLLSCSEGMDLAI